jgi:hypothetical protein
MMRKTLTASIFALLLSDTASALIGYGIPSKQKKRLSFQRAEYLTASVYKPNCAFACRDQFSSAHLSCSSMNHDGGGHHGTSPTSKECYASNTPWLTTLAYCINATCGDVSKVALEAYWAERVTKSERWNKVSPKWTYQETLFKMADMPIPSRKLEKDEELNFTALYDAESWEATRGAMQYFELAETMHSTYG